MRRDFTIGLLLASAAQSVRAQEPRSSVGLRS